MPKKKLKEKDIIKLKNIRTHNLKGFDLEIPKEKLVVITGVSGSGKSSLAFDTLYAEGQRRFVESLSSYARQFLERMEKPELDSIAGILPAIAIEAKNVITNARSTVGTQTEVNDYLRVLMSRVGSTFCHSCGEEIKASSPQSIFEQLIKKYSAKTALILFGVSWGREGAKYLKDFLGELVRQGFLRVRHKGNIYHLEDKETQGIIKGASSIQVIADRTKLETRKKKRILESLETAYARGHGKCEVLVEEKNRRLSLRLM